MREHRLQWFGNVMGREEEDLIGVILRLRFRGRPKLTWKQAMRMDMASYVEGGRLGRPRFTDPAPFHWRDKDFGCYYIYWSTAQSFVFFRNTSIHCSTML